MIKQQIFRMEPKGCRTAAVSSALLESAWLPLLEQQAMTHYTEISPIPVYYQFPFGTGLVVSRCSIDQNNRSSASAHHLIIDDANDLAAFRKARPIPDALFLGGSAYGTALPELEASDVRDAAIMNAGFRLIDSLFDETLLAKLFEALLWAARDKQQMIHIMLDEEPIVVSRKGRLLMEMLMRCLPEKEVTRLSWCTLLYPNTPAFPYSVCISPRITSTDSDFSGAEGRCIRFDLYKGTVVWPDRSPRLSEKSLLMAQALLAHDLRRIDQVQTGEIGAPRMPQALKIEIPPFEEGMSLTQYVKDWADTLEIRHELLNDEAFLTLAGEEWPLMIGRIISACDVMPNGDFIRELHECLVAFAHGRASALGMTDQHYLDLVTILTDSIDWDQVDLFDPAQAKLLRSVTEFADLLDENQCDKSRLLACRVIHSALSSLSTRPTDIISNLAALNEMNPDLFEQVQNCAHRYVVSRCRSARKDGDEFTLADDLMVALSIIGYVRFSGRIPDMRQLNKVREAIASIAGQSEARRYSTMLDKLRKSMHASRSAHVARRREMRVMLFITFLLALVIAGVMLTYFLFLK